MIELGYTDLKTALDRPYNYHQGIKPAKTEAMQFGTAVHWLTLQTEKAENIRVKPEEKRNTRAGKAEHEAFEASLTEDDIVLRSKDYEMARNMANVILRNVKIEGEIEHIYKTFFEDKLLRASPDVYMPDEKTIVDIKTTQNANPALMNGVIVRNRYHLQAGLYTDVMNDLGHDIENYYIIAIEKTENPMLSLNHLSKDMIDIGRSLYKKALANVDMPELFKTGLYMDMSGEWPSRIHYQNPPKWAFSEAGLNDQ